MNLLVLLDDDFVDPRHVRLTGRRLHHVRTVHRAAVGDVLRVGRLNGRLGTGRVARLDDDAVELEVILDRDPPPPPAARLLVALPRPKVLRRVLQCAAAIGVKQIDVLNTWRVEKSFWQSPALRADAVRAQLILGLEQGGDTALPTVALHRLFKPFVEDELPGLLAGTCAFVAHPGADRPCPHAVAEPFALAVGPEGDFIPYEIDLLRAAGCEPVSLGPRPLRVEHAVPALLARLLP